MKKVQENKMYDLVLLHPGGENMLGLQGPFFPIGWLGIASILKQYGYNVKIINCFLEKLLDPSMDIKQLISNYPSHVYGIDLHWFIHSFEAIALAEMVAKIQPKSKIVLGGLTSSIFTEEILREFDFIDCIIKGEGELPFLRYIEIIKKGVQNFDSVPNISYRSGSKIIHNQIKYVASRQDLDNLDFLDFSCVLNFKKLFTLRNADYTINAPNSSDTNRYLPGTNTLATWPVYTGRGCCYNCSFCGGSRSAFKKTHNRSCLTLRSPKRIANDIIRLDRMGIQSIYFPHSPLTTNSEFNKEILTHLRKSNIKLNCGFFFEDVPFILDFEILKEYMEIFNINKSVIRVYAIDHDTNVRKKNNFNFSWKSVQKLHEICKDLPVTIQTAVLIGLPGQNKSTCERLAKELKKLEEHHYFPIIYTAEMHPASLLHDKPHSFGISQSITTFHDFYKYLRERKNKAMFLGYDFDPKCPAQEQKHIIEEIIHYDTKFIHIAKKEKNVLYNNSYDIEKKRCNMSEYKKMITEAHAVKAERVVFSSENILQASGLLSMLNICKALNLAITFRTTIKYLSDSVFIRQLCHGFNIDWEFFAYENDFAKQDSDITKAKKIIKDLSLLGQMVRGYIIISGTNSDWIHILSIFESIDVKDICIVIDGKNKESFTDPLQIREQLLSINKNYKNNVKINFMSEINGFESWFNTFENAPC